MAPLRGVGLCSLLRFFRSGFLGRKILLILRFPLFPIPKAEAERYGAEYRGAIADGALKERTREEWEAQNQKDLAAEKAAAEKAKKAAKPNTP
jgi:hypothetical protein